MLGLASLTLGILGFLQYSSQEGSDLSFWDSLYLSLQLFSMQVSFESYSPIPGYLRIARFLSPSLAAYTLSQAFVVIFKEQLELFRLVRSTNHIVICGLGQKGLLLAKDLRKDDQALVIIEQESNNPHLEPCRELGAIVIIGNARDARILLKAGVRRARRIIVVCGDDGTNLEIIKQTQRIMEGEHKNTLTCTAHIVDSYLMGMLKQRELTKKGISAFRVELFNVYDASACLLLREAFKMKNYDCPPHLLVIGLGNLGESIIVTAAREWGLRESIGSRKLVISVVDPNALKKMEMLKVRFPLLKDTCEFHCHKYRTNSPDFQKATFTLDHHPPVTNAYICFDDSLIGFQAGFALLQILHNPKIEIMVRMNEDSGLVAFLKETMNPDFENLKAFGLLEHTCRVNLLEDGFHDTLARAIHDDYMDRERYKGNTPEQSPNMVAWSELPDEIKESNRRQADHIGIKLASIGCSMEPWREYGRQNFLFAAGEIDKMARVEHQRWCEDKLWAGWKYAEIRDDSRKLHPDLIGWDDGLSDEAKDKDIASVKLIPHLLARAGFQIYRIQAGN